MPLVTKAADERLNQLNFQMASLRFGMAKEIAAQGQFVCLPATSFIEMLCSW